MLSVNGKASAHCSSTTISSELWMAAKPAHSLPNDLHWYALPPPPVKFPIEDPFPGPQVQPPFGDGNYHFAPHDLPPDVRVCIVLAGVVVAILARRLMRRHLLKPAIIGLLQAEFTVVGEHRRRDVQRVHRSFTITTIGWRPRWFPCLALQNHSGKLPRRTPRLRRAMLWHMCFFHQSLTYTPGWMDRQSGTQSFWDASADEECEAYSDLDEIYRT